LYKILLLEDDEILSQTLNELLEIQGYEIYLAKDGNIALDFSFEHKFDLYLLDVNVPFLNGFDFLKELRDSGDETPAFFLTALRDIDSLSKGFQVGADDYIKKPFEFNELLVRIKAKLKVNLDVIVYKDLKYNIKTDNLKQNNININIPQIDKKIFLLFLKNCGNIVNKSLIFELMETPSEVGLRVHITKIKKLLHVNITNIRGQGYILEKI